MIQRTILLLIIILTVFYESRAEILDNENEENEVINRYSDYQEASSCIKGKCISSRCRDKCCPGYGFDTDPGRWFNDYYCTQCNCGKEFNCTFNKQRKKTCVCPTGYKENSGVCKADCSVNPCQNSGKCTIKGNDLVCNCTELYTGEFCEKITYGVCVQEHPECEKTGGSCTVNSNGLIGCICKDSEKMEYSKEKGCEIKYEVCVQEYPECQKTGGSCTVKNNGPIQCICKDSEEMEYFTEKGCEIPCNDDKPCLNGGLCTKKGYCSCLDGYYGSFCEKIYDCEYLDCGPEAKCVYDATNKRGKCQCTVEETAYDPEIKKCKITCNEDRNCFNGGLCTGDGSLKTCSCLSGTEGPLCERVPACKQLDCGTEAKCVYDAQNESGKCICMVEGMTYDPTDMLCKITCNEDRNCLNGGLCTGDGSLKTCSCLSGTAGPLCERIPACKLLACGTEAKCVYDAKNKTGKCVCSIEGMVYDPIDMLCKNLTSLVISKGNFFVSFFLHESLRNGTKFDFKFGLKDVSNQTKNRIFVHINSESLVPLSIHKCSLIKCQNGGKCEIKNETAVCTCLEKYAGDYCETDKCLLIKCQNGGECDIKNGKAVCVCSSRYLGSSCEIDKCSLISCLNGGKCDTRNGKVVCICKDKFTGEFCEKGIEEALPVTIQ